MNKTLYLFRGLPGAGKSTLARKLFPETVICEADQFLYEDGQYIFTKTKLKEAHESCKKKAEKLMSEGSEQVVVSNTLTQEWEMEFYINTATKYGYEISSIILENRHGNKNIHDCPDEHVEVMRNRFQIKL